MALASDKLGRGLLKVKQRGKGTPQQVAGDWAQYYTDYAMDAQSPLGSKPEAEVSRLALEGALTAAFSGKGTPAQTADAIAAGLAAFWLPVIFPNAFPGAVTGMGPPNVLSQAIQVAWGANLASRPSDEDCAQNVAKAIHAWTKTVIVTHPTVPFPTVGPIT